MKILMAFLADEANISQDGKLNVLGVFDRISAGSFPVMHPRMVFAFRVYMDAGDSGRGFQVRVRLLDEANAPLFEANGEIGAPVIAAGDFATANQLFGLVGLQFEREGVYRFVVNIGGTEHETPFLVQAAHHDPTLN
jgi:hypothetical protein